ncbi:GNAT family N-acetyltransferase [Chitinophagaceae bacterium MMS25-I14]
MLTATVYDRDTVISILAAAFDTNKSVNYLIPQDARRPARIRKMMEYSFDMCMQFGVVYLSEDRLSCALTLLPECRKTTLRSIWLDIKLITGSIGIANVSKALKREAVIKKQYPQEPFYYLWFIGTDPAAQGKGTGSRLLQEIIAAAKNGNRPLLLETSATQYIPWYQRNGLQIYHTEMFSYPLYFMHTTDNKSVADTHEL